jgi:hypothetical protein
VEVIVNNGGDALTHLITEIGQAAHAGWAPTGRRGALLAVATGAVALIVMISR